MISRIRVKRACFACGGDVSLSRFLAGMPCPQCEDHEERVEAAKAWPAPYRRLLDRFEKIRGEPPPRAWQPWTLAVLNGESIRIPLLPEYRPLDFILWMAGGYKGPVIIGVRPQDQDRVLSSKFLADRTLILQGRPDAGEVRVLTQPEELSRWDFRNYRCFIGWLLPPLPALEEAKEHGGLLIHAVTKFPYQVIPGAQVLGADGGERERVSRTLTFPGLRFRPEQIPADAEVLASILYQLLPFLPASFRPLYQALVRLPEPPDEVIQRIRRTLTESLLDPAIQRRLRNAGVLRDHSLQVADVSQFLQAVQEAQHPRVKACLALAISEREARLLDRALHPFGHVLRQLPDPAPLRDTHTLLVLPDHGPTGRDLGFTHLWERRAAGFTVFEGVGNLGPLTLLRLPPVFHIQGSTIVPDPERFPRLRRLFRRYPRITVMTDEGFLCQAVLLAAIARPYGGRIKVLRFTNLYSLDFEPLEEPQQTQRLMDRIHLHIRAERRAKSLATQSPLHLTDPRLYELLREIEAQRPKEAGPRVRVVVDGLFFEFPLPEEEEHPENRRHEIQITTEIEEVEINPPPPHTLPSLIQAHTEALLKEQLQNLQQLYQQGLITTPWQNTPVGPFFREMAHRYIRSVWGEAYLRTESPEEAGILTTRPIDRQDLALLSRRFPLKASGLDLYDRIFRRWIAGFLRPTRVRRVRIQIQTPWGSQTQAVPFEILEMGFNVLVPLKLGSIPATGQYTVTRIERRRREHAGGISAGTLVRLACDILPDVSPLQSIWQIRSYLQWTDTGIVLTPEARHILEDLEIPEL